MGCDRLLPHRASQLLKPHAGAAEDAETLCRAQFELAQFADRLARHVEERIASTEWNDLKRLSHAARRRQESLKAPPSVSLPGLRPPRRWLR